ncbi:MAG: single-strand DNA-binding protein [Patescibacteria group bacterium]|nr:single-strand DNA-binding protein [Patescibacteria group bacterium]
MNLNKVFLIGNLTRDVTLKTTPTGQSVAEFGLATNRVWLGNNNQKQQEVEFHNIVVWGKMAELCNQYLAKGRMVFIEGRLRTRTWQDSNGQKRFKTEIIAENIQFGPKSFKEDKLDLPPEPEAEETAHEELPVLEEEPTIPPEDEDFNSEEVPF